MLAFLDFYQNRFINVCARKKKAKILESQIFLVRCIRTYVLNNSYYILPQMHKNSYGFDYHILLYNIV